MNAWLPLTSPEATLETVGGKGANLARLARAGLPVPGAFLLPVGAYRTFVAENGLAKVIEAALQGLDVTAPAALEAASAQIRSAFAGGMLSLPLRAALDEGYRSLGDAPVAVRSSATAEDLPDMSFAGQQDTYLNVRGIQALQDAVVACWSSLWTARAIGYRARNGVSHGSVALAVVVQEMVPAQASGVLFTANPLSGRRTETVVDATLGLGEALVSGQVEPDHYVVESATGVILHKSLGSKAAVIVGAAGGGTVTQRQDHGTQQAVPDDVIGELAALGRRVQELYGAPQDIEWAWANGRIDLLQARPITSLYPLPDGMPLEPVQAMTAFAAIQGVFEPFTPLGQDSIKLLLSSVRRLLGYAPDFGRQTLVVSAGERLYINVTPVLSNQIGRNIVPYIASAIDPGVALAYRQVVQDPHFAPAGPVMRPDTLRRLMPFAGRMARRIVRTWRDPDGARRQLTSTMDAWVEQSTAAAAPTGDLWRDFDRTLDLLLSIADLMPNLVVPLGVATVIAGMAPFFGILERFATEAAEASGRPEVAQLPLTIARSLPYNVTTEMDLALWQAAEIIRSDAAEMRAFQEAPAAELAAGYLAGRLPPVTQMAVAIFMYQYGMRGPGEIDIGRPRWCEQPEPLMQTIQSYLAIADPEFAPDAVFARGLAHAEAAAAQLLAAVAATPGGRVKQHLVRWGIGRYRAVAGLREAPKFFAVRMMNIMRRGLLRSGAQLAADGQLEQPGDLFFLTVSELQEIGSRHSVSPALRERVTERRALREREMRRRQLPRVLLSDGTAYYAGVQAAGDSDHILLGDPVSPGVVEGIVHVVLSPSGAQLAPGEILVCPGTDPAWTPLFLAAGGLVMEVGGMMTHGSVVAREYGIPAVVGVHEATSRLHDGQRIRVDGMTGTITLLGG